MIKKQNSFRLVVYAVVVIFLFLGLVQITLQGRGMVFALEALGTLVLALLAFSGFVGYRSGWGERLFFLTFLLSVLNLLLLRSFTGSLYLVMLVLSLLGLALSLTRKRGKTKGTAGGESQEPHSVVFDSEKKQQTSEKAVSVQESPKEAKVDEKSVSFHPGKYVASTRGSVYHEAKCDWAKKVGKTNRLWFQSRKEATDKGYQAHSCVN